MAANASSSGNEVLGFGSSVVALDEKPVVVSTPKEEEIHKMFGNKLRRTMRWQQKILEDNLIKWGTPLEPYQTKLTILRRVRMLSIMFHVFS